MLIRNIIISLSLLVCSSANAQIEIKSTGRVITENAVESSIVVIRQAYQLQNPETKEKFGRGGLDEFGFVFSIGVHTQSGLVLTEMAINPWRFDPIFKKYEERYSGVVSKTEIRETRADSTGFRRQPLKGDSGQPEGLWVMRSGENAPVGMAIETSVPKGDGFMVWCYVQQSLISNPSVPLELNALGCKLDFKENKKQYELTAPKVNGELLGGIYVTPLYVGDGKVEFHLVGMAVKENSAWLLKAPFTGMQQVKKTVPQTDEAPVMEEPEEEPTLTPIDGQGKKKANKSKDKDKEKENKEPEV